MGIATVNPVLPTAHGESQAEQETFCCRRSPFGRYDRHVPGFDGRPSWQELDLRFSPVGKDSTYVSFVTFKGKSDTGATAQILRMVTWTKATGAASVIKVIGVATAANTAAPVEGLRDVHELIADKWMVVEARTEKVLAECIRPT